MIEIVQLKLGTQVDTHVFHDLLTTGSTRNANVMILVELSTTDSIDNKR
ncbi:hypothetical protein [Photobacterium piscicola]